MKVIELYAENLKRLKAVQITPHTALVQVTGANGSGKTSVLDALYFALAGKKAIDPVPVRRGEESAVVKLDLGDVVVTRKFDADGSTQLYVTTPDGAQYGKPQALLDTLLGSLTFDPLEFTRLQPKDRSDALRKLVGVDVSDIDRANQVDFDARTGINRQIKDLSARKNAAFVPEQAPERVDISALVEKMRSATEFNGAIQRQEHNWRQQDEKRGRLVDEIADAEARITALRKHKATLEESLSFLDGEVRLRPTPATRIDTADLARQIDEAQRINAKADADQRAIEEYAKLAYQYEELIAQAEALTETMEQRKREKAERIAAAAMPIEGLTLRDEDLAVLYNGLPFEQASGAEQLKVSVAIAMAMHPKLRVLRIKDGSLLDEDNLAMLAQMAELEDFQIWIERVDTGGRIGIVMEDGAVKYATALEEATR